MVAGSAEPLTGESWEIVAEKWFDEGDGTTCDDEGVARLYDVSTAPWARRRGMGRMISMAPLLEARKLGYHYAALQSSDEGRALYEGLVFVELYREENYVWRREG